MSLVIGGHAIATSPGEPDVLTHFDHLGFEAPNGLGHLNAPGANGGPDSLSAIEEILDCGADDLGSDVKRPRRDDCFPGNPSAIGGRTRRAAGTFRERARERGGAAHAAQSLCMPKCRDRALVVLVENYRVRLSADFGDQHPKSG